MSTFIWSDAWCYLAEAVRPLQVEYSAGSSSAYSFWNQHEEKHSFAHIYSLFFVGTTFVDTADYDIILCSWSLTMATVVTLHSAGIIVNTNTGGSVKISGWLSGIKRWPLVYMCIFHITMDAEHNINCVTGQLTPPFESKYI